MDFVENKLVLKVYMKLCRFIFITFLLIKLGRNIALYLKLVYTCCCKFFIRIIQVYGFRKEALKNFVRMYRISGQLEMCCCCPCCCGGLSLFSRGA